MAESSASSKEAEGCGGKSRQKTESLMKRRSHKTPSTNTHATKYSSEDCRSINVIPQKTYIFWILVFIIVFIAAVNFSILVIMISVLRIGEGMESIELVSHDDVIKFHGAADLDHVLYSDGSLKGFQNLPLEIQSEEGSVIVSMKNIHDDTNANKIQITDREIAFSNIDKFFVYDPTSRRNIFSTDYKDFKIPKGLPHLDVKKLRVNRLLSAHDSNLTVKSDDITRFRGNAGLSVRGKEIFFTADGDVYLNSVNGSIYLLSDNIKIDMKQVPIVIPNATFDVGGVRPTRQFKLCVCMPHGYLFKVPVLQVPDQILLVNLWIYLGRITHVQNDKLILGLQKR